MKRIFLVIILVVVGGMAYWLYVDNPSDNEASIEFIKSRIYNGQILDLQQDLDVDSVKDIKWYMEKDRVTIEYGSMILKYSVKDLEKQEIQNILESVFITVKQNKNTKEFTLYFQGEEITKYVKK